MRGLYEWLLSLKGIEPESGAELRLELTSFPSGGLALLVVAGALAALITVFAMYRRERASLSPRQRGVLAALRGAALLLALLVVLEPNIVAVKREERPGHVILLLDRSQSMAQRDAFRRAEVQPLVDGWRAAGIADPRAATRFELARAALSADDGAVLRVLAERNRLQAYGFDAGLEPLDGDALASSLAALRPDGRATDLGAAVRAALERSRDASVAGLVVLTDGRRNRGAQAAEVARMIARRKAPRVLVLPVGDPSETQLIELVRVEAPEKVFQKDPFRIAAEVTSQGYDRVEVRASLQKVTAAGAETVASRSALVGAGNPDALIEFDSIVPTEPGVTTYRVVLEPPDGEPHVDARHQANARVEVLSEQTKVLLIAGGPSLEYRFLQIALYRDKTIDLSCWLCSADPEFPQDGNTSLATLPAGQEELEPFDVVILLDPDAAALTRPFCEQLARHISTGGAGMWWVCGEKFSLDALRDSASTRPLAELLPVEPDLMTADRRLFQFGHGFESSWPWTLTADGRTAKVTRLYDRTDENEAAWMRLPGFHLAFPVLRAKPAATTLVTMNSPLFSPGGEPSPLIASQLVGAGRVLFTGTDETYRWRSAFEKAYTQFWVRGVRFLFEGRLVAGNRRLRIRVGEERVELGQAQTLFVTARDQNFQPLAAPSLQVSLERQGGAVEMVTLDGNAEAPGEYRGVLRPTQTGYYSVSAEAPGGAKHQESFEVVPAAIEREGPVDLAELSDLAGDGDAAGGGDAGGGGLLATAADLRAAAEEIPSRRAIDTFRTPHPIWDTWLTIASILGLLSLEWWLRKRFNLL